MTREAQTSSFIPRLAEHIALALVRLRALDQHFRFGGIDPSHWLFDREWLRLRVEEEVDRAQRYGHPLTLLLFLFENLDEITRNVGRHQTEVFLRRVAAVIRGQIRSPDVLAGYGKASIAVLMPETEKPAAVAAQLRVAVSPLEDDVCWPTPPAPRPSSSSPRLPAPTTRSPPPTSSTSRSRASRAMTKAPNWKRQPERTAARKPSARRPDIM